MCFDCQGICQFAIAEYLEVIVRTFREPDPLQRFGIHFRASLEVFLQRADIHSNDFVSESIVVEAPFRNKTKQRHLATSKTQSTRMTATAPGTLMTAACSFAVPRTGTATKTLTLLVFGDSAMYVTNNHDHKPKQLPQNLE